MRKATLYPKGLGVQSCGVLDQPLNHLDILQPAIMDLMFEQK